MWFCAAESISYWANANTKWKVEINNWADRDPLQVTCQGSEYDFLWGEQSCQNGQYVDYNTVTPTGDNWYDIPLHTNKGLGCESGIRLETGTDRDHSLYVVECIQALTP